MLERFLPRILAFHVVSIAPLIGGALIGAAGSLLGGIFSDRSSRRAADDVNRQQRESVSESNALQREFAQSGIRWRVEDAKAAGLHPLYAIGANVPTYSPTIGAFTAPDRSGLGRGLAEAGQHLGRAVQAQQSPAERTAQMLSLGLQRAQLEREVALTQYYDSLTARNRQEAFQSAGVPDGTVTVGGLVKTVPDQVTATAPGDPSKTAGVHAGWREYTFGQDKSGPIRLILPINEEGWSEGLSELPIAMYPLIYRANLEKYGAGHAARVMKWILHGSKGPAPFRGRGGSGSW